MKKKPTFVDWIDETGTVNVAKLLGVSHRVVSYWRDGHCVPRPEQMRAIRKLSKGKVTYEAIIDGGGAT